MRLEDELKNPHFASEQTKAIINILFTASYLHNHISTHLKKFGLSHEQFNVLRILKGQHPKAVAQKDILHRMIDRNSNLTRIIAKLKEKKLITVNRSETDKREYEISLNESAFALLSQAEEGMVKANPLASRLNVSEAFHLNALLEQIRNEK